MVDTSGEGPGGSPREAPASGTQLGGRWPAPFGAARPSAYVTGGHAGAPARAPQKRGLFRNYPPDKCTLLPPPLLQEASPTDPTAQPGMRRFHSPDPPRKKEKRRTTIYQHKSVSL
ncbi:uncharacterized protein LOC132532756 [Erinaceus europaeus]|uniref:Uncharacterized protein LOC132532756 n=1 Tax=Erinaceus europaeus TaxID=9365 RepID=A0ABM3VSM6_ERIEU|nr:uncharacterized protein LOC132532756 [Erinaceus europaeus]